SIGNLTIDGNLTIRGNLAFKVNKTQTPSNDVATVTGTILNAGAGTLTVSKSGPALAVGDRLFLFNKPVVNGGTLSVTGAGVQWTNNLAVDGSIAVLSVIPATPTNLTASVTGKTLSLAWPTEYKGWTLQAQTNPLEIGLNTNWVDMTGSAWMTSTSLTINPANPAVFFRLRH
ncbi:MAG TPA: hypothetical protein VKA67_03610, partial [Verrucomicrobiae bacterium]|nr:hypothetical protein [Verrucomicrobiae bacterium]